MCSVLPVTLQAILEPTLGHSWDKRGRHVARDARRWRWNSYRGCCVKQLQMVQPMPFCWPTLTTTSGSRDVFQDGEGMAADVTAHCIIRTDLRNTH